MKDSTALCWSARARTRATSSAGAREDELAFGGRERGLGEQIVDGFGFVARPRGGDARAGGLDGGREFGGEDVAQGGVSEMGAGDMGAPREARSVVSGRFRAKARDRACLAAAHVARC